MQQFYIREDKPASNATKDLFKYCVRKVIEKSLFDKAFMHNQWANLIFGYEKDSDAKIDLMSRVRREYSTYFTRERKYSFDEQKIKSHFPNLFGLSEDGSDDDSSIGLVYDNIRAVEKEIMEQHDPRNMESFKGSDLALVRKQGDSYIYHVRLTVESGEEPNFHDSIPFILHVYGKEVTCETIDFDYETGILYFTAKRSLNSASYCRILLDSTFILDGLKKRLTDLKDKGVDEDMPFAKFIFDETEEISEVEHKAVPYSISQRLDKSQKEAFDAAIDHDITLIWGPPGTGKSFTLASIIFALYHMGGERSVVCCLSNVAVDQLLCKLLDIIESEKLKMEPGNIYRAGRSMDSRIMSTDYLFPKDEYTKNLRENIQSIHEDILRLKELKREQSEESVILKAKSKELRDKLREHTEFLVKSSRLVFSTISNFVLNDTLYESQFDNLIVDEASMVAMPSLLALGHKISKRLILVGDFQQLPPISVAKINWLTDSVFEMAGISIKNTNHPALHQLLNQRRSNEKIVDLINRTFYQGKLIPSAKDKNEFVINSKHIINSKPFSGRVIALKKNGVGEVRFTKGGTRQNTAFAESVMELLDELSEDEKADYSIGVITPYRGQVSLIRFLIKQKQYADAFNNRIKTGTVHSFQGSECDIIIFDMVDCPNPKKKDGSSMQIGKLYAAEEGERLLNVAVSRAKHKLIVVCDHNYMENIPGNRITQGTRTMFRKLSRY